MGAVMPVEHPSADLGGALSHSADWPGSMFNDWYGGMFGALVDDVGRWAAARELDALMSSVRKTQDFLIASINLRGPVAKAYDQAKALYDQTVAVAGGAFLQAGRVTVPNPQVLPAMIALASAKQGLEFFARQVQTLNELDVVYTQIAQGLHKSGLLAEEDVLNAAHQQILRFTTESDAILRAVPAYQDAKNRIIAYFTAELAAAGIPVTATDDPRWFQSYLLAAEKVVPLPAQAKQEAGMAGAALGDLGAFPIIGFIVGLVLSVGAVVVALRAMERLLPDVNAKAKTAYDQALIVAKQRADEAAQMRAAGRSEAEIAARMAQINKEAEEAIKKLPEPASPLTALLIPAAAVAAAAFILPKVLG